MSDETTAIEVLRRKAEAFEMLEEVVRTNDLTVEVGFYAGGWWIDTDERVAPHAKAASLEAAIRAAHVAICGDGERR